MRDATGRLLDIAGAAILGIVVAPLVGLAACAIVATSGLPAFYVAERLGRDERPFACFKLRTMRDGRVTAVGAVLRAAHVDELPQLWNVLRGEMRLVGPRPLPATALAEQPELRRARCAVAPGLTGLAQVRAREHAPSAAAMLPDDLGYVARRSIALDLAILARTPAMLARATARAASHSSRSLVPRRRDDRPTMPEGARMPTPDPTDQISEPFETTAAALDRRSP